jgi:hypothetical protein
MTKILFSNPPWWEQANNRLRQGIRAGSRWPFTRHAHHSPDNFRFGGYLPFPFFLAYAAAYTQRALPAAHVTLRDSIARGESYAAFSEHLAEERYDYIVIETATPSWQHDSGVLALCAAVAPEARIILTGTLPCEQAHAIFRKHVNVCAIVQGEYDKRIAVAITEAGRPNYKPRVFAHNLLTVAEMNAAPFPMVDPVCEGRYADGCPSGQLFPHLQVWTSRGCPFHCIFCVWPAVMTGNDPDGTKPRAVRCYSPDYVEAMIRAQLERGRQQGVFYRTIYLDDDTFNLTDKHALAISAVMKRIGLPWSAMCRVDTVKPETWRAMREAGCFGVKLGFESGSQQVIDTIVNKRLNLAKAETETLPFLQTLGFTVHTTWTIGLPGETPAQQNETRAMIQRLYNRGLHQTHQLSGTAEIEGTPLHTLRSAGHLAKYSGAVMDTAAALESDGQKKIEGLTVMPL